MKNKILKFTIVVVIVVLLSRIHIVRTWNIPEIRPFGHLFIEITHGTVITDNGDGVILGEYACDCCGWYISYKNVPDVKRGDCLLSVFVYNPLSPWCDDCERIAYIRIPSCELSKNTLENDFHY